MSSNEIENNDVNESRLAEQGNLGRHHANPVISKRKKRTSQENKIVRECYLLSKPKIRGYRKCMMSLWLQKGMLWVSEQRLVDQANIIRRNSWMTELEIEELERKVTGSGRGKKCWGFAWSRRRRREKCFPEMGAEEQPDILDEEEVVIVMEIVREG